jgi:signal transduction histidine kinase/HAMP domain-containing protein
MKRLRSRLIAAFLGVAFIAMVPLALVSFYTLQIRFHKVRTQLLEKTADEILNDINFYRNVPGSEVLFPLAQYLQQRFLTNRLLVELLEFSESLEDPNVRNNLNLLEGQLWRRVPEHWSMALLQANPQLWKRDAYSLRKRTVKYPQYPIQLLPNKPYQEMKKWADKGFLYEENNKLYCYVIQDIVKGKHISEIRTIGGLFLKTLLIEKFPDDPSISPVMYIKKKEQYDPQPVLLNPQPKLFEKYFTEDQIARLFGFEPYKEFQEINIDRVQIDPDDTGWPERFRISLQKDQITTSDNNAETITTVPMQIKLLPVVNHRHELSAIIALGTPITSILSMIGYSLTVAYGVTLILIVIAAVLFSRTLSKPINELAGAARCMADGDFDVRVKKQGTEEQRLLSSTFNQLATRIQQQIAQLRDKTDELEFSNLELAEIQHFLQSILANINTGVMSISQEGKIGHINQVGERILQIADWKDKHISESIDSYSFTNLVADTLRHKVSKQENEILYECGDNILSLQVSLVPVLENDELKRLVVTFHDLTTLRHLEEEVRRQDRLAALGRMSAGLAHEIRNPLGIIQGSAELLRNRFGDLPGEEGLSEFILGEVRRLSRVVNDFLVFARPPSPNLETLTVDELLNLLEDYFDKQQDNESYTLVKECADDLPEIAVDVNLCRQAFLNLFINAQEAMPDGGKITLRSYSYSAGKIAIDIEDQGEGITPEQIDKIFDPFYTSKDRGTGLGLSLVHQIIDSHEGKIEVENLPEKGCLFRLIFPTCKTGINDSDSNSIPITISSTAKQ